MSLSHLAHTCRPTIDYTESVFSHYSGILDGNCSTEHKQCKMECEEDHPGKRPGLNTPAFSVAPAQHLLAQVLPQSLRRPLLRRPAGDAQRLEACFLGGRGNGENVVFFGPLDELGRQQAEHRPSVSVRFIAHIPHPAAGYLPADGVGVVDQKLVKVPRSRPECQLHAPHGRLDDREDVDRRPLTIQVDDAQLGFLAPGRSPQAVLPLLQDALVKQELTARIKKVDLSVFVNRGWFHLPEAIPVPGTLPIGRVAQGPIHGCMHSVQHCDL
jgi:hypothetical protein